MKNKLIVFGNDDPSAILEEEEKGYISQ